MLKVVSVSSAQTQRGSVSLNTERRWASSCRMTASEKLRVFGVQKSSTDMDVSGMRDGDLGGFLIVDDQGAGEELRFEGV